MDNGWITLHRKLLDHPIASKPIYLALWVHLLLMANHRPKEFMWNGSIKVINDGQFITGRDKLVKQTGIPGTTIERILDALEKWGQIGQQKTTKYRLVTIVKWRQYQSLDNKRTTNGQQTDTNNNVTSITKNEIVETPISSLKANKKKNMNPDYNLEETDEDGAPLVNSFGRKKGAPKTSKNKDAMYLNYIFEEMCLKEFKMTPSASGKSYFSALYALNSGGLTVEQAVDLLKGWFRSGKPQEEVVQITRAFSANNINIYKVQKHI